MTGAFFSVSREIAMSIVNGFGRRRSGMMWTESIAVGTEAYIARIQNAAGPRREVLDVEEKPHGVWTLRDSQAPYTFVSCPKTPAKPQNQARNLV